MSMGDLVPRWSRQYKLYRQTRNKILKQSKVHYRYVVNMSAVTPKKMADLKQWLGDPEVKRFHIGYYLLPLPVDQKQFPYHSLMIVDS